jgi:hypothetical protein
MFYVHEVRICCVLAIFERRRGRPGSKISGHGQLAEVAEVAVTSPCPVYPRKQTPIGRGGMSAGCQQRPHDGRPRSSILPYLRAIWLTCSRVSCFGGTPGGLQVSRKKPSRPGGTTIQECEHSNLLISDGRAPPPPARFYSTARIESET